jgi:hypothetical protein
MEARDMNQLRCANECYSDLSFMGVVIDPNCDAGFCNYLYDSGDGCHSEEACCC